MSRQLPMDPAPAWAPGPSFPAREARRGPLKAGWWRCSRWAAGFLIVFGAAAVGVSALTWSSAGVYQTVESWRLDTLLHGRAFLRARSLLGLGKGSYARIEAARSGLVGRLEIPRAGISTIVREGVDPGSLLLAAGHFPDSAFPGESGNVAISAHRDSYFRGLKRVVRGDPIRLTTPDGVFNYTVSSIEIVGPDRRDLVEPTKEPTLTLITCYPFGYIGSAPKRFVVRAHPSRESAGSASGGSRRRRRIHPR